MDCSKAIEILCRSTLSNPICNSKWSESYSKALIRRAMAFEYLGNYSKGLRDITTFFSFNSDQVSRSLLKTAIEIKSRLEKLSRLDDEVSKLEGRPSSGLFTEEQSLRLVLMSALPAPSIAAGESFSIKLCIANEMGLWDRSLLGPHSRVGVSCSFVPFNKCETADKIKINIIVNYFSSNFSSQDKENCIVGIDGKVCL
jgi:hypothetical protein